MAAITLEQAKQWLRIDSTFVDDDQLIQELINAAERWVETYTSHVLSPRDVIMRGERGKCCQITYLFPINSIPEGTIYDTYSLYTQVYLRKGEDVTINVGYTSIELIPAQLLVAAKKIITYCYENRDWYAIEIPGDVQVLINQLRRAIVAV